jgi:alpha-beta hydrolase superfamily lysophospholipase
MKHVPPAPPVLGQRDRLAYALFLPEGEPAGGVVILHGAGSAKESHFDFARVCRARGLAALAFDARGHGRSDGAFGPAAFGDVLSMCDLVRQHAPAVALRGSSMGGFCAIHAAALDRELAAVVAICPSPAQLLLSGMRSGRLRDFAWDPGVTEEWLKTLDLDAAAAALGPGTALLLLHAAGDDQVPVSVSESLHAAAREPKRLVVFPGGHHRSLQHDVEVQNLSVRFVERAFAAHLA